MAAHKRKLPVHMHVLHWYTNRFCVYWVYLGIFLMYRLHDQHSSTSHSPAISAFEIWWIKKSISMPVNDANEFGIVSKRKNANDLFQKVRISNGNAAKIDRLDRRFSHRSHVELIKSLFDSSTKSAIISISFLLRSLFLSVVKPIKSGHTHARNAYIVSATEWQKCRNENLYSNNSVTIIVLGNLRLNVLFAYSHGWFYYLNCSENRGTEIGDDFLLLFFLDCKQHETVIYEMWCCCDIPIH